MHGFPADYLLTALTVPYLCGNAWLERVRIAFAVCTLLHRHALRKAGLGFFFFFFPFSVLSAWEAFRLDPRVDNALN